VPKNSKPVIKPQVQIKYEQVHFKIDSVTLSKLQAYCNFISSEQAYVIREALNYLFEADHTFQDFFKNQGDATSAAPVHLDD
jgi:hypothetical protein